MLPWKLRKRHILPASQILLSVYFSLAKFQLVSCNLSLAMIWQRTYTHELPELCSATLKTLATDFSTVQNERNLALGRVRQSCLIVRLAYNLWP